MIPKQLNDLNVSLICRGNVKLLFSEGYYNVVKKSQYGYYSLFCNVVRRHSLRRQWETQKIVTGDEVLCSFEILHQTEQRVGFYKANFCWTSTQMDPTQ